MYKCNCFGYFGPLKYWTQKYRHKNEGPDKIQGKSKQVSNVESVRLTNLAAKHNLRGEQCQVNVVCEITVAVKLRYLVFGNWRNFCYFVISSTIVIMPPFNTKISKQIYVSLYLVQYYTIDKSGVARAVLTTDT